MYASTLEYERRREGIVAAVARSLQAQWRSIGNDFDLGWSRAWPGITNTVQAGQVQVAAAAVDYGDTVFDEAGFDPSPYVAVPSAYAGTAESGATIAQQARTSVVRAKQGVQSGASTALASRAGEKWLQRFAAHETRRAGDSVMSASVAAHPTATGYVRMIHAGACSNCIILAGKWFRWNTGFQRHPSCKCTHIPARESGDSLLTNPYEYFGSLSREEQDRAFGENDAEAIRQGADIYRVVNTRARGLSSGRTWQSRRYDSPSTMSVDEILDRGLSKADTRALLAEHGFITGRGQVSGGSMNGNAGGSFFGGVGAGTMGRGGARRGATAEFRRAVETGVRDPLSPATQTAAERRFHVAYLRREAALAGRNPFRSRQPLTDRERALIEADWARQLAVLRRRPGEVLAVARRLGLI